MYLTDDWFMVYSIEGFIERRGVNGLPYCVCPQGRRAAECLIHNIKITVPHSEIYLDACSDPSCIHAACQAAMNKGESMDDWRSASMCDRINCALPRGHAGDHIVRRDDGNLEKQTPTTVKCRCGCNIEIAADGTYMGADFYEHWKRYNAGVSYSAEEVQPGTFRLCYSPEWTGLPLPNVTAITKGKANMRLVHDGTEVKPMAVIENQSIDEEVKAGAFILQGYNGKRLVKINYDGNVEIFGDVNEAAMQFWTAVCQLSGGALTKRSGGKGAANGG